MRDKVLNYFPYLLALLFFLYALNFIGYGLPLHLVGDEESLIGGALKMLELRSIAPIVHQSEFSILYYPTLLPYLYVIFWLPYLILIYFFAPHIASITELSCYVLTHLDMLWILARIPSVIAGSALIVVLYKIARKLFPRDILVALFSSCLLSLSFLHFQLSIVSGHWIFDTLFFFLVVYFLLANNFHDAKSSIWAGIFAGLGFGSSSLGFVSLFFASLLYLVLNLREHRFGLANKKFWYFFGVAIGFAAVFIILHPGAYLYVLAGNDTPGLAVKNFGFIRTELASSLYYLFSGDFMITTLSIVGLVLFALYGFARYALISVATLILYEILLVYFFHNAPRYHIYLIPIQALAAGYAIAVVYNHFKASRLTRNLTYFILFLVFLVSSVVLGRYSALLSVPTTEQRAAEWIRVHASKDNFIIDSSTISFFQSDDSMDAQQDRGRVSATARALRDVDITRYGVQKLNYTNLHFWNDSNLTWGSIEEFVRSFTPRYYIVSFSGRSFGSSEAQRYLLEHGSLIRSFSNTDGVGVIDEAIEPSGDLGIGARQLFRIRRFGQNVNIYALTF